MNAAHIDMSGPWQIAASAVGASDSTAAPTDPNFWAEVSLPEWRWEPVAPGAPSDSALEAGPFVWVRRVFELGPEHARCAAVLRWEHIRWGVDAWVNGQAIGGMLTNGPGMLSARAGILRAGSNELLLKVRTWGALERGGDGSWPLIPAGGSVYGWGSTHSGVFGGVWIDVFGRVGLRSAIMVPSLKDSTVTAHVRLHREGPLADKVQLSMTVATAGGAVAGRCAATVTDVKHDGGVIRLRAKLSSYDEWSPEHPALTHARIVLRCGEASDTMDVSFGMRTIETAGGDFLLNGKPHSIMGSNIVAEWLWGPRHFHNTDGEFTEYLTSARAMNARALRTHTTPPLPRVAALCDTSGMLLLAEMPFTYNYQTPGFTLEQTRRYHQEGRRQSLAWVELLANHPSVAIWVSTNEPPERWGDWDQTAWDWNEMIPAIKAVDPSRPVLRAGEDSPDILDMHCYDGFWGGAEGDYDAEIAWRTEHADPLRPLGNSEYIENFNPDRMYRWLGTRQSSEQADKYYAMVGMRQTETLRRHGFDLVLPYMLYGWTKGKWRPYAPTPMYAALRNALATVCVSAALETRNAIAGDSLAVPVWLVNDSNDTVRAELSVHVCSKDPEFWPSARALTPATRQHAQSVRLAPRSRREVRVEVRVPAARGTCWVAAVLAMPADSVMSQRQVNVRAPMKAPSGAARTTLRVVGADSTALAWLTGHGVQVREGIPFGRWDADADALVIWEDLGYSKRNLHVALTIDKFVRAGRRVVVLHQNSLRTANWHWGSLEGYRGTSIDFDVRNQRSGLVIVDKAAAELALWKSIAAQDLMGWNGLGNALCRDAIVEPLPGNDTSGVAGALEVLARNGDGGVVLGRLRAGAGQVILCQILLADRIDRAGANYDPVAETLLLNLLCARMN